MSTESTAPIVQYQIAAARRQHYDNLLWQTPVISMTAQAFLFTIALGNGEPFERSIASFLACVVALASIHLMAKHRFFELEYAKKIVEMEKANEWPNISDQMNSAKGVLGWSTYRVWRNAFWIFFFTAILVLLKVNKATFYG
jgi:hypothetical protein